MASIQILEFQVISGAGNSGPATAQTQSQFRARWLCCGRQREGPEFDHRFCH